MKIELTKWQVETLEPLINLLRHDNKNGRQGGLFAQIVPTGDGLAFIVADYLDHETGIRVQTAIGQCRPGQYRRGDRVDFVICPPADNPGHEIPDET